MNQIRVLVVDDSLTVRKHIVEVLSEQPSFTVIGEGSNGKQAIELCEKLRPDVITMDMMMPVMTGVAATEYIMAYCPTPILVVSASTNRGELFRTYDALAAGAVDVLEKPDGTEFDDGWARELASALRVVSRVKVITHPRARLGSLGASPPPAEKTAAPSSKPPRSTTRPAPSDRLDAIGIGASTGGPGAVLEVLRKIPARFEIPILLVIHIGEPFARALADWLDAQTALWVRYPVDGERLDAIDAGTVVMAPPERHMVLSDGHLRMNDAPERHSCRPSVDVLFDSLAANLGGRAAACLLTGMGKDGAAGMLAIRAAGGTTVAQDEATSVVWGMPGEAVQLGAATHTLPIEAIGNFVANLGPKSGRGPR